MSILTKADQRAACIAGLRELADFLENNPDVPVGGTFSFQYSASVKRTHAEAVAEVDRVAALLGVGAGHPCGSTYYQANKHFGPVTYHVVAMDAEWHQQKAEDQA